MWKTFGGKIQKSGMGIAMQQLECRFYPRQEIAEALSVNPKDSKHFAERVKTTLDKWGYEYEYSRSGVEITGKPETAEERLREILIQKLNLDVQIDAYAFACFICAFTDIGSFDSMPWEERAELMKYKYGVDVSDRTLRNWCSKLISSNIIQKCGKQTYWKTEIYGKEKYRSNVDPDDEDMARYFQMKSKYLEETRKNAENLELRQSEAAAWSATYKKLWREFQCCYYTCNGLVFNAIGEDYIFEIYELAQEITAPPTIPLPVERKITTKEEYRETWFNL